MSCFLINTCIVCVQVALRKPCPPSQYDDQSFAERLVVVLRYLNNKISKLDTSKQSVVKAARSEPKGQAVTNDQAAVSDPLSLSNKLDVSVSADTKSVLKSDLVG